MVRKIKIKIPKTRVKTSSVVSDHEEETDQKEIEAYYEEQETAKILWDKKKLPSLEELKRTLLWNVIDACIEELIAKEDIIETTVRKCIVSYIIYALLESKTLKDWNLIKEIKITLKPPRKYPVEPYIRFKSNPAWKVIDQAIEDLVENQDLVETTVRKCIVGYILKRLIEHKLVEDIK